MSLLFSDSRAALFPLGTVLFPGCTLPLQVFEQRYLRLVKTCLQDNHGFVVILISAGKEVGDTPETYSIGTYVEIIDWETLENGLLGVTIQAKHRVRITHPSAQDDGLMTGQMEMLDALDTDPALADENITDLVDTLKLLEQHPYIDKQITETDYASTKDVCNKLSQLLPVDMLIKQSLLEINNTSERISKLRGLIHQLQQ